MNRYRGRIVALLLVVWWCLGMWIFTADIPPVPKFTALLILVGGWVAFVSTDPLAWRHETPRHSGHEPRHARRVAR